MIDREGVRKMCEVRVWAELSWRSASRLGWAYSRGTRTSDMGDGGSK
jgi:hypothetical protein